MSHQLRALIQAAAKPVAKWVVGLRPLVGRWLNEGCASLLSALERLVRHVLECLHVVEVSVGVLYVPLAEAAAGLGVLSFERNCRAGLSVYVYIGLELYFEYGGLSRWGQWGLYV